MDKSSKLLNLTLLSILSKNERDNHYINGLEVRYQFYPYFRKNK